MYGEYFYASVINFGADVQTIILEDSRTALVTNISYLIILIQPCLLLYSLH
jgi:hypothetical protein